MQHRVNACHVSRDERSPGERLTQIDGARARAARVVSSMQQIGGIEAVFAVGVREARTKGRDSARLLCCAHQAARRAESG
jgi:hypothetical protein